MHILIASVMLISHGEIEYLDLGHQVTMKDKIILQSELPIRTWFLSNILAHKYGSAGKESACNVGDLGLIPGLGGSSGEGKGYPLQYYGLENYMDSIVHGVSKSSTWLSDFHFFTNDTYGWIFSRINGIQKTIEYL